MKIIKCLVVEDSVEASRLLVHQLEQLILIRALCCYNFEDAKNTLSKSQDFDIIFLDMNLGDKTGIDLLRIFSNLPPVIVCSSHSSYAIDSYESDSVVDYVVYPLSNHRLLKAINRAFADKQQTDYLPNNKNFVYLKVGRKLVRFEFDAINYIEAYGTNSQIFRQKPICLIKEPISNLAQILPSSNFIRVHKSYIVNIRKITGFDHNDLYIDSIKIPIGISYKPQLEPLMRLFDKTL